MASGRRILGTILLLDALAFGVSFALALYSYSADRVIPLLALRWESAEAFLALFRWLPALQLLGLALALGLSEGNARELVNAAIPPATILSALVAAAVLLSAPALESSRSATLAASSTFNSALSGLRAAIERGDAAAARAQLDICESVDRRDRRVQELAEAVASAELKARRQDTPPREEAAPAPPASLSAKEYYLKGLGFYDKGDWLSAHWYASTAARIDPAYTDAKRLAAKAWEQMGARSGDKSDKERADRYARKVEGYGLLQSGDAVGAYRVFKELADAGADDPDVRRYLKSSLEALEKSGFLKDEADRALAATRGPFFLRAPAEGGTLRVLAARDAAWAGEAVYFREPEYLEASGGTARLLVRSPYGKLARGKLFLLSAEKENPERVYRPAWKVGPGPGPANLVDLPLDAAAAWRVTVARSAPASLPVMDAWRAAGEAASFGVDPRPLVDELMARSGLPFALFTSSAIGALAGARFRRGGKKFPRHLWLLVPFMAAALVPATLLASRVDALIGSWASRIAPGLAALGVAAGMRAGLLFAAVLLLAGARDDHATTYHGAG